MEAKHAVFLFALALALTIGPAVCRKDAWRRDACAFLIVFGTTRADLIDINFVSREWYRGTTRGFEISWLDLLVVVLFFSLPRDEGRRFWTPAVVPMLMFVGYNAMIVFHSDPALFGMFELSKMFRLLFVFITFARYVRGDRELRVIAWALAAAVAYELAAALRGRFWWKEARVRGTLAHANSLSMYELMSIPVLVAVSMSNAPRTLRRVCGSAALFGVITVLFTVSRNGVLTLSILLVFLGLTCGSIRHLNARHIPVILTLTTILSIFIALTYKSFVVRFETEGLEKEYTGETYEGRGAYLILADGIADREPYGCGLNNWSWCVSNRYGPIVEQYYVAYPSTDDPPPRRRLRRHAHIDDPQAAPAHSLYAITLGETGRLGVAFLGLMWARWLTMTGWSLVGRCATLRSRFGVGVFGSVIGALCQSFSEWEIRQTPLAFLLHALLGAAAAAHVDARRDWTAN